MDQIPCLFHQTHNFSHICNTKMLSQTNTLCGILWCCWRGGQLRDNQCLSPVRPSCRPSADVQASPASLNIPSPVDHSVLASDAVGRILTGSVHRCGTSTWSRWRALFPYPITGDGGDSFLDYSIQNDNKKRFFSTKNQCSKTIDFNISIVHLA